MSVTCQACNVVSPSGSLFCSACGKALSVEPSQSAGETSSTVQDAPERPPLADHIAGLLVSPTTEWRKIADEQTSAARVFWRYGAGIGLIAPCSIYLGYEYFGQYGYLAKSSLTVIGICLSAYAFLLLINIVSAYCALGLGRIFGSSSSLRQAMKISIYGQTPGFLAWAGGSFPSLRGLFGWSTLLITVIGFFWSIYLFRKGAIAVLDFTPSKARAFSILLGIAILLATIAVLLVPFLFLNVLGR